MLETLKGSRVDSGLRDCGGSSSKCWSRRDQSLKYEGASAMSTRFTGCQRLGGSSDEGGPSVGRGSDSVSAGGDGRVVGNLCRIIMGQYRV